MKFLARFRILTKLIAVLSLLAVVAICITVLGIEALSSVHEGASWTRNP